MSPRSGRQVSFYAPNDTQRELAELAAKTSMTQTAILVAAVRTLHQQACEAPGMIIGWVKLDRAGDVDVCPECRRTYGDGSIWVAVHSDGHVCAPVCSRCATSEQGGKP
jgi:hypothetical protein